MIKPYPNTPERIFIAPLDWGLGHATRCIPLIDSYLREGFQVMIGGNGRSLAYLKDVYPSLTHITLPSYDIIYSAGKSQIWAMIKQLPNIRRAIKLEHEALKEVVEKYKIELIISDNRYGIWHSDIHSIFICHQLALKVPSPFSFVRPLLYQFHLKQIAKFNECWIPDVEGFPNLSFDLSHQYKLPPNYHFIGPLSRFQGFLPKTSQFSYPELNQFESDIAIILSGPEPQRTMLETILIGQAKKLNRKCWIVQGKTEERRISQDGNVWKISYMNTEDMYLLLNKASVIISRPGYTSLMDYAQLELRKVILIPTPGQTEQEYLGKQLHTQKIALCVKQDQFQLTQALQGIQSCTGFSSIKFDPY